MIANNARVSMQLMLEVRSERTTFDKGDVISLFDSVPRRE